MRSGLFCVKLQKGYFAQVGTDSGDQLMPKVIGERWAGLKLQADVNCSVTRLYLILKTKFEMKSLRNWRNPEIWFYWKDENDFGSAGWFVSWG